MEIFVCDDEAVYRDAVINCINRWKKSSGHSDILIKLFSSSEELLDYYENYTDVDLIFLDIKIPQEINGIKIARKIREINNKVYIVFITNYDEYVYDGYEVNALRFLRKPIVDDDIFFCCSYVYNRICQKQEDSISFNLKSSRIVLHYNEIMYIEAQSHTLYICTGGDNDKIKILLKLSDIIKLLPSKLFVYCHRSYIVNVSHIRIMTKTTLTLNNGIKIPISKTYADKLYDTFDHYFRGGKIKNGLDNI